MRINNITRKILIVVLLGNVIPIGLTIIGISNSYFITNNSIDINKLIQFSYIIGLPIPIVIYLILKVCKII